MSSIIKYEIWEAFGGIDLQAYEQTADMKIINHISSDEEEVGVVVIEVIIIFTIKFVFFLFFVFFIFLKKLSTYR